MTDSSTAGPSSSEGGPAPAVGQPGGDALLRAAIRHSAARCVALCLLSTAGAGIGLLLPYVLGRALDALLTGHATGATGGDAGHWLTLGAALVAAGTLLDACEGVLTGTTAARTTAWLRHRLVRHVLDTGPRATARFPAGDLVARLVGGTAQAAPAPATVAALAATLLTPLGAIVALGLVDLRLALVFLVGAPALALLLRAFARATSDCVSGYLRAQGDIATRLTEAIGGARTIAAARTAGKETDRILAPLPELARQGLRMWRVQGRASAGAVTLAPLLQIAVIAAAGLLLLHHHLSVGELLAASRYAVLATGVGALVGDLGALVRTRAAGRRTAELLDVPAPRYGTDELPVRGGHLELCGVTVRRAGRTVLDRVDLTVPAGRTLAVVGASGAGKSTLAALAGRLTDPDEGTVLLDGVPLPGLSRHALRTAVGHAFERPVLLGDTLADTIALSAPKDRVIPAARAARADPFVRRLPDGYATVCADVPLSGGELQRLGLARAFAHGGRLLVLDDALSSLDTVTEHEIAAALLDHTPGATRLIVAHRATTAARADTVAWLDGGRVRALGPHERLWHDPAYRAVFAGEDGPA
ncbi:ATP-binding cassette subfamily B protein [Streptomyces sp. PsTaAH-137]|uniref:ABC transporter transmembrane domain-containing protein n=1 Tax=Streptomyces sp. PsTaAH-137 TaxID=1305830 RepID=UPI000DB9D38B|nr:ATP-binding cassette domain-containing protein [Streptomyces sp. SID8367]RAJ90543.1 ATP-binding cassette subfamily B protein [Streptomyces sp. PsTaAH-137]